MARREPYQVHCDWQSALRTTFPTSSRNLLANPFNCNCQLAWLGDWLRKRKIVTGNPRCQNPDFLRQIPLQDVAFPDFRCEEGNVWASSRERMGLTRELGRQNPTCGGNRRR